MLPTSVQRHRTEKGAKDVAIRPQRRACTPPAPILPPSLTFGCLESERT